MSSAFPLKTHVQVYLESAMKDPWFFDIQALEIPDGQQKPSFSGLKFSIALSMTIAIVAVVVAGATWLVRHIRHRRRRR